MLTYHHYLLNIIIDYFVLRLLKKRNWHSLILNQMSYQSQYAFLFPPFPCLFCLCLCNSRAMKASFLEVFMVEEAAASSSTQILLKC